MSNAHETTDLQNELLQVGTIITSLIPPKDLPIKENQEGAATDRHIGTRSE